MVKNRAFLPLFYLVSIVFLPCWISLLFTKSLESWLTNWWNTKQCETFLNDIQEKSILERFIALEDLFLLNEMIKEYPEAHLQNLGIGSQKELSKLINIHNEDCIHTIFHFSTNVISFLILSAYAILGNEELLFLNSWIREFICNLSDTIKAFLILLVTDFCVGYHSHHGWELMISSISHDFGFAPNDQILSVLGSILPVIVDTILKYWVFHYLNRLSPSLVVIYHSMNEPF
uniref:envelope membrane protein n=1 Tax=Drosera capensis TaxID=4366 RepID=UPI0024110B79|nr:envelope membrane protein [Drosera capensis]WEQ03497.1 envelope membrane protein [Drosera capensis]